MLTDGRTDGRKIGCLYRTLLQAGAIKIRSTFHLNQLHRRWFGWNIEPYFLQKWKTTSLNSRQQFQTNIVFILSIWRDLHKKCGPKSEDEDCGILSGSTMFAKVCPSTYLEYIWYEGKSISNQPIPFPTDRDTQDFHALFQYVLGLRAKLHPYRVIHS